MKCVKFHRSFTLLVRGKKTALSNGYFNMTKKTWLLLIGRTAHVTMKYLMNIAQQTYAIHFALLVVNTHLQSIVHLLDTLSPK